MIAQILPRFRESFLYRCNRIRIGEIESIDVFSAGDQVPALDDRHFIVEGFLLLIGVIGKHHPCSLPIDEPSPNVSPEEKGPKCFLFDFNWMFPATTAFRLVPRYELQNVSAVFYLVKNQDSIRARLITRKPATGTGRQFI